jgi:hypothetical protein
VRCLWRTKPGSGLQQQDDVIGTVSELEYATVVIGTDRNGDEGRRMFRALYLLSPQVKNGIGKGGGPKVVRAEGVLVKTPAPGASRHSKTSRDSFPLLTTPCQES